MRRGYRIDSTVANATVAGNFQFVVKFHRCCECGGIVVNTKCEMCPIYRYFCIIPNPPDGAYVRILWVFCFPFEFHFALNAVSCRILWIIMNKVKIVNLQIFDILIACGIKDSAHERTTAELICSEHVFFFAFFFFSFFMDFITRTIANCILRRLPVSIVVRAKTGCKILSEVHASTEI